MSYMPNRQEMLQEYADNEARSAGVSVFGEKTLKERLALVPNELLSLDEARRVCEEFHVQLSDKDLGLNSEFSGGRLQKISGNTLKEVIFHAIQKQIARLEARHIGLSYWPALIAVQEASKRLRELRNEYPDKIKELQDLARQHSDPEKYVLREEESLLLEIEQSKCLANTPHLAFVAAERILLNVGQRSPWNPKDKGGGWDSCEHYGLSPRMVAFAWQIAGSSDNERFSFLIRAMDRECEKNINLKSVSNRLFDLRQTLLGQERLSRLVPMIRAEAWVNRHQSHLNLEPNMFSKQALIFLGRLSPLKRAAVLTNVMPKENGTRLGVEDLNLPILKKMQGMLQGSGEGIKTGLQSLTDPAVHLEPQMSFKDQVRAFASRRLSWQLLLGQDPPKGLESFSACGLNGSLFNQFLEQAKGEGYRTNEEAAFACYKLTFYFVGVSPQKEFQAFRRELGSVLEEQHELWTYETIDELTQLLSPLSNRVVPMVPCWGDIKHERPSALVRFLLAANWVHRHAHYFLYPNRLTKETLFFLGQLSPIKRAAALTGVRDREESTTKLEVADLNHKALEEASTLSLQEQAERFAPPSLSWEILLRQKAPKGLEEYSACGLNGKFFNQLLEQAKKEGVTGAGATVPCYNLARLFKSEQALIQYRKKIEMEGKTISIHDLGQFVLPTGKWSSDAWRNFVIREPKAITQSGRFSDIEALLHVKYPSNAIQDILSKLSLKGFNALVAGLFYNNVGEDTQLAILCHAKGVVQATFKKYQDLMHQVKSSESVPYVRLADQEVGLTAGWVFRKLDAGDPMGPLLGLYTNCCQHLEGAASSSARHGVLSPYGGFYVVEHKGEIVAQSWAWRGKNGELVFDSIEVLGDNSHYREAVQTLYQEAAKRLMGRLCVSRVLVGSHPSNSQLPPTIESAVRMDEEKLYAYTDACTQYVLADKSG